MNFFDFFCQFKIFSKKKNFPPQLSFPVLFFFFSLFSPYSLFHIVRFFFSTFFPLFLLSHCSVFFFHFFPLIPSFTLFNSVFFFVFLLNFFLFFLFFFFFTFSKYKFQWILDFISNCFIFFYCFLVFCLFRTDTLFCLLNAGIVCLCVFFLVPIRSPLSVCTDNHKKKREKKEKRWTKIDEYIKILIEKTFCNFLSVVCKNIDQNKNSVDKFSPFFFGGGGVKLK